MLTCQRSPECVWRWLVYPVCLESPNHLTEPHTSILPLIRLTQADKRQDRCEMKIVKIK